MDGSSRNVLDRWRSDSSISTATVWSATWRSSNGRDHPHRYVVGSTKPVHGDDAELRKQGRYVPVRRALLRLFPQADWRRSPDAGRGDRRDGLRLEERHHDPSRIASGRIARLVPE